jgi:hypothetical protein
MAAFKATVTPADDAQDHVRSRQADARLRSLSRRYKKAIAWGTGCLLDEGDK